MINGEAPASAEWAASGQWMVYAEQNGAVCFLLEHRFYGNSKPTKYVHNIVRKATELTNFRSRSQLLKFENWSLKC